jgi:hypothetical protein
MSFRSPRVFFSNTSNADICLFRAKRGVSGVEAAGDAVCWLSARVRAFVSGVAGVGLSLTRRKFGGGVGSTLGECASMVCARILLAGASASVHDHFRRVPD